MLASAILSVANASAIAANAAVLRVQSVAEEALVDKIERLLSESFGPKSFKRDVEVRGRSGGKRHFDFTMRGQEHDVLINGVSPHPASVSAKYVAFADAEVDTSHKLAVYDRQLETDDTALLQQVAYVVPLGSLNAGARRAIANGV
jgi:hypothetical protein